MSSIIAATFAALYQWRYVVPNSIYSTVTSSYASNITGTNWWSIAQMIFTYGLLVLYSFGAFFQMLAMFGMA